MKLVLEHRRDGSTRTLEVAGWGRLALSLCLVVVPLAAGLAGYQLRDGSAADALDRATLTAWESTLREQSAEIARLRQSSEAETAALTRRVAEMHSRLLRLDALGERVAHAARLDAGEFDFSARPALGGPEEDARATAFASQPVATLQQRLDSLAATLEDREQQLAILSSLLTDRHLQQEESLTGRPIRKGWLSSPYGRRTDPFNGRPAWHNGVDFAGKAGSDIVAVAAGVVTVSGERHGYGRLVEINHGNGFVTRYGHTQENRVAVGDIVKKGQVIAYMGSSGRSTGPHVHFEVYKHGRSVDPAAYVSRTLRY